MGQLLKLRRILKDSLHVPTRRLAALAMLLGTRRDLAAVTFGLDNVFYPRWRRQSLDRPVFIIGNPRSGTTFLHRLLLGAGSDDNPGVSDLASMELWEMMFPAITSRKLLGGVVPKLDKINPAQYHDPDAHDTSLTGIETDDLLEFFHTQDGPFAWAYFQAWQDSWGSVEANRAFGIGEVDPCAEKKFFEYTEKCWRKNLIAKNKTRVLVKSSMLTFRLKTLLRRYPDAKLLYIVRDPVETIPSGLSLLSGALENGFDIKNRTTGNQRAHWLENLYQASKAMFIDFHHEYVSGHIPERNLLVVRFSDMMKSLEPTIDRIVEFIEVDAPEEFLTHVKTKGEKQRAYTSKHGYSPEEFNLTAERIRHDLSDVYQTFSLDVLSPENNTTTEPVNGDL